MPKIIQEFLKAFSMPSSENFAQRQLEEAERSLLLQQDAAEYHDAMVIYLETKIARLRSQLAESHNPELVTIDTADLTPSPKFM